MLKIVEKFDTILDSFSKVSLSELESLNLLNRYDTKFVVSKNSLPSILMALQNHFNILEINGKRNFNYFNQYFDTQNNLFFNQHHNGNSNRYKIRFRHYLDSETCFLEIKHKTNNSMTFKSRIKVANSDDLMGSESARLIKKELLIHPEDLVPRLQVSYNRISLVNTKFEEKITLDTDIHFSNSDSIVNLSDIVLVELKQKRINHSSFTFQLLKQLYLHPISGISKYCLGMVFTDELIKYNKFKQKILLINKLRKENGHLIGE